MTQVYKLRQTNVDNGNIHLYIYECQKYVTEEFTLYLKSKEAEKKRNALENMYQGSMKAKTVAANTLEEVKHSMKIDYFENKNLLSKENER